ncbi:hypothetical protein ACVILL_004582 [Bradyrhizobium sp. USDA 3364]
MFVAVIDSPMRVTIGSGNHTLSTIHHAHRVIGIAWR